MEYLQILLHTYQQTFQEIQQFFSQTPSYPHILAIGIALILLLKQKFEFLILYLFAFISVWGYTTLLKNPQLDNATFWKKIATFSFSTLTLLLCLLYLLFIRNREVKT